MIKKEPTQQELFSQFIKEFDSYHLCFYCLNSPDTIMVLCKLPDESFFRHIHLCPDCINNPKIEVK